ncbi:alpha/beta hydrolase [Leeuwenhoekiella sp. MAR_2009_132]|uniref:alpha/beta hydrolase n=1 Tax=Leeuwenhoekiella sp. MAR_2009_132 TaxID=1392489 RepID=UPI000490DE76|nr:alpha/beta hydrolase [Leeuwenhoekiella sp. MAR_2009_132]
MKFFILSFFLVVICKTNAQEYTESEIQVNSFINGTLLHAKSSKDTLAIIIGGSGPTDRNGNQRTAQNNSLKKLAEELSKKGISTYRYDKRIFTLIQENALIEEKISFDDFVTDAVSVIDYFKKAGFINIVLIGHSQGALIATLAAEQRDISHLIGLAGAGQSIDKLIVDQLEVQAPGLVENAKQAFTDLREKNKSEKFSVGLISIFRPSVQPFMKSWMKYDPAKELSKINAPILLVNGTKDLQVTAKEGELLKNSNSNAKAVDIDGMNHVLKIIEGDELENSKSYNEPYRPVAEELINLIVDFVRS